MLIILDLVKLLLDIKKNKEAIFIKNSSNEIVNFTPTTIINISYFELKGLRDESKLKPGQYYRIIDYVTTVGSAYSNVITTEHPFDIIIFALDKNKLCEKCYAIQHENDTYFSDCNLAAWQIWYDIDNDNGKYEWASSNGTGVIYRMIDEWQNDCPYDFKNIMFKRYKVTDIDSSIKTGLTETYVGFDGAMCGVRLHDSGQYEWMFTFTKYIDGTVIDNSLHNECFFVDNGSLYFEMECTHNTIHNACTKSNGLILNNIVLISDEKNQIMSNNFFGEGNYNMTLMYNLENNKFGSLCHDNIVCGEGNVFGVNCSSNTIARYCWNNKFDDGCSNNLLCEECTHNSFGTYNHNNILHIDCCSNSFKDDCYSNILNNGCYYNLIGYACHHNTFRLGCTHNILGCQCSYNYFDSFFQDNSVGSVVRYINVGQYVYNTEIHNNIKGNSESNKLTLNFQSKVSYKQIAGLTSTSTNPKIWVPGDVS